MMETFAAPAIKRANPDTTKTLSHAGVSTVYEAQGSIILMKPEMRPVQAETRFHYVETLDDLGNFNGIDCRNRN